MPQGRTVELCERLFEGTAQGERELTYDAFVEQATKSIAADDKKYLKKREDAVAALDKAYAQIEKSMPEDKALEQMVNEVTRAVNASINPLDVIKDSAARTFERSLKGLLDRAGIWTLRR